MTKGYTGTVVVVPTRNRSDLAVRAIQSVLDQAGDSVEILVSDNSTSERALAALSQFFTDLRDDRVHYVRPPKPMSMTDHWAWVLNEALRRFAQSHFTYLTDRMVLKPGAIKELQDIASEHPDAVTSYNHDMVADDKLPICVQLHQWSGKVLKLSSARLLYLSSQSFLHESLPRMLNCHAPRHILAQVKDRFGSVFASSSPDYNFCYRLLDVIDSVLFYDKALLVHYALRRSNGASAARGEMTPDYVDFLANLQAQQNYAAPIPQIPTVANAIIHEYCVVRNETKSRKFPEVNLPKYMQRLALDFENLIDLAHREELEELLRKHGWPGRKASEESEEDISFLRKLLSPRRVMRRLLTECKRASDRLLRPPPPKVPGLTSVTTPPDRLPEFGTTEAALEYAVGSPRPRCESHPELDALLNTEDLPA